MHRDLLNLMLSKVRATFQKDNQPYLLVLYQTMLTMAYYEMFRVGEIATGTHPILAKHIHLAYNK